MHVRALHIHHFRGLSDFWFLPNPGANVIIGPNNAGKTTVLDALRLALDPSVRLDRDGTVSRFDFHNQELDERFGIRVWLQLGADEPEEVKLGLYDKLTKWQFREPPPRMVPLTVEPMARPEDVPTHEELVCVRVTGEWDQQSDIPVVEHCVVDEEDVPRWRLSLAQRRLMNYRHYGVRRDPVRELSLSPRSPLSRDLDEEELAAAFRDLLQLLESQRSRLAGLDSVSALLGRLGDMISGDVLGTGADAPFRGFTVTFLERGFAELRQATTLATEHSQTPAAGPVSLPLSSQGNGTQNALLLAYLADALRTSRGTCIVSLEEPEQNLEPPVARWVFRQLMRAARAAPTAGGQVFVTTHSPVLAAEADGAAGLVIMRRRRKEELQPPEEATRGGAQAGPGATGHPVAQLAAVTCSCLDAATRKSLERHSALYASALFARQVLIVEGPSEVGCLPVFFRRLAGDTPEEDPFHLGLEMISADGTGDKATKHAEVLQACGKSCHILLDRDLPADGTEWAEVLKQARGAADYVSCWSRAPLLGFAQSCDLEVVLTAQVSPPALLRGLAAAYEDAGHELLPERWHTARGQVEDETMRGQLPHDFPADLHGWSIESMCTDRPPHAQCGDPAWREANCADRQCQRAFLYAALHGPHSCKSAKDMRMIAERCADANAAPNVVDVLRTRILTLMRTPARQDVDDVYLAP